MAGIWGGGGLVFGRVTCAVAGFFRGVGGVVKNGRHDENWTATLKAAERELRDARVLELFYAGASYRAIAEEVGLRSKSSVGLILQRQLAATGDRRELLADEARSVWLERFEQLWAAQWPAALGGDRYAVSECRRMLGHWAAVFGLSKPVTLADTGRLEVVDVEPPETDDDLGSMDELARLRYNRANGLPPHTRYDAS